MDMMRVQLNELFSLTVSNLTSQSISCISISHALLNLGSSTVDKQSTPSPNSFSKATKPCLWLVLRLRIDMSASTQEISSAVEKMTWRQTRRSAKVTHTFPQDIEPGPRTAATTPQAGRTAREGMFLQDPHPALDMTAIVLRRLRVPSILLLVNLLRESGDSSVIAWSGMRTLSILLQIKLTSPDSPAFAWSGMRILSILPLVRLLRESKVTRPYTSAIARGGVKTLSILLVKLPHESQRTNKLGTSAIAPGGVTTPLIIIPLARPLLPHEKNLTKANPPSFPTPPHPSHPRP